MIRPVVPTAVERISVNHPLHLQNDITGTHLDEVEHFGRLSGGVILFIGFASGWIRKDRRIVRRLQGRGSCGGRGACPCKGQRQR
jgi:hypothetical protein